MEENGRLFIPVRVQLHAALLHENAPEVLRRMESVSREVSFHVSPRCLLAMLQEKSSRTCWPACTHSGAPLNWLFVVAGTDRGRLPSQIHRRPLFVFRPHTRPSVARMSPPHNVRC